MYLNFWRVDSWHRIRKLHKVEYSFSKLFVWHFLRKFVRNRVEKMKWVTYIETQLTKKKKMKKLHCDWWKERPIEKAETNEWFLDHTGIPFVCINLVWMFWCKWLQKWKDEKNWRPGRKERSRICYIYLQKADFHWPIHSLELFSPYETEDQFDFNSRPQSSSHLFEIYSSKWTFQHSFNSYQQRLPWSCNQHCYNQENQSVSQTNEIRSKEMPSLSSLAMAGQCFDEVRNAN